MLCVSLAASHCGDPRGYPWMTVAEIAGQTSSPSIRSELTATAIFGILQVLMRPWHQRLHKGTLPLRVANGAAQCCRWTIFPLRPHGRSY